MKNIDPTKTKSWKKLKCHFKSIKKKSIKNLFKKDENRFKKFYFNFEDKIFVDFSKNILNLNTINLLINLAKECNLNKLISYMYKGKKINNTENLSVLHVALRDFDNLINNKKIKNKIYKELKKIEKFSKKIISGKWKGCTGLPITDVVNIGIGGSEMGPKMIIEALNYYRNHIKVHFLSNVDNFYYNSLIKEINLETTIFIIVSKTFTTDETLNNASKIKNWFLSKVNKKNIKRHFFAVSNNKKLAKNFGIYENNIFNLYKWVGGRYSLWSSVGISIAICLGFKNFKKLLKGANSMDKHFFLSPFKKNIPVLAALISIWYNNFFKTETESIIIYSSYMTNFINYYQQLSMESNGKNVDKNNKYIKKYKTGSIIWGGIGTNSQHTFCQLLHQGNRINLCDFIGIINSKKNKNKKLISNLLSQTHTLAFGDSLLLKNGELNKNNNIHLSVLGNKPSNTILLKRIDPYILGALIAIYEHKTFVQGVIWNINSFDQFGVELGKKISKDIEKNIENKKIRKYDISTNELIKIYNKIN
ncbi:MAG: glucose-6-phosphate isomerase [Enterobacteriaceae bacterium]